MGGNERGEQGMTVIKLQVEWLKGMLEEGPDQ